MNLSEVPALPRPAALSGSEQAGRLPRYLQTGLSLIPGTFLSPVCPRPVPPPPPGEALGRMGGSGSSPTGEGGLPTQPLGVGLGGPPRRRGGDAVTWTWRPAVPRETKGRVALGGPETWLKDVHFLSSLEPQTVNLSEGNPSKSFRANVPVIANIFVRAGPSVWCAPGGRGPGWLRDPNYPITTQRSGLLRCCVSPEPPAK